VAMKWSTTKGLSVVLSRNLIPSTIKSYPRKILPPKRAHGSNAALKNLHAYPEYALFPSWVCNLAKAIGWSGYM
jgi:hypothetical protein